MKNILALTVMASAMLIAPSAHALTALDGWQLDTTSAVLTVNSVTTNIGHMGLLGGLSTVNQEVNGRGNPFVRARFSEFGNVFSVNWIAENSVGTSDSGIPQAYNNALNLEFVFTGLAGTISAFNSGTGETSFLFDNNVGDIFLRSVTSTGTFIENLAEFEVSNPSGGTLGNFNGAGGIRGTSNVLGLVKSSTTIANLFRDSSGNSLDPLSLLGKLFLEVDTTNTISSPAVAIAAGCDFGFGLKSCKQLKLTSEGAGNLFAVPEPGSLALLGMGLLGFGAMRRRVV